jgi:hypothetical protein
VVASRSKEIRSAVFIFMAITLPLDLDKNPLGSRKQPGSVLEVWP